MERFPLSHYLTASCLSRAAILSLAALVLQFRARKQQPKVFWFFRRHYQTQSRIPYIVPHPVNVIVAAMLATSLSESRYLAHLSRLSSCNY